MPPNERGRPGEKAASQKITGGRSENHSNLARRQDAWCHTDEFGLMALPCFRQILDAEERAYVRGFAAGRESVYADIEAEVAGILRNAVRRGGVAGAPSRNPYALRGSSEQLHAFAAGMQAGSRATFQRDHAERREAS